MKRIIVAAFCALAVAAPAAAQPNVVLIVTDDQRWDTLGYMSTVQSELVGKGVTFTNSFVVNAVCCPSRASLLTGEWSHTTGVWGIQGPHGGFHVFDDHSTLPVWLDSVGYRTMLDGKYLNGYLDPAYVPPGWDRWFAHTTNQNAYFDWGASDGGAAVEFGSEPGDYSTDVLAARAVDFIRGAGEDPFFLYFAPKAPHYDVPGSVTPAPRHVRAYDGLEPWQAPNVNEPSVIDKPSYVRNSSLIASERIAAFREDQLESLLAVDEAVAGMLAALEETAKLEDTLIVFTSDNGHGWGEHRRMNKVAPYEESIRVPLVIRWDALGIEPRRDESFALNVDLAKTIAAAAGIDVRPEGRNLLSLILNPDASWRTSFLFESDMWPDLRVPPYCAFRGALHAARALARPGRDGRAACRPRRRRTRALRAEARPRRPRGRGTGHEIVERDDGFIDVPMLEPAFVRRPPSDGREVVPRLCPRARARPLRYEPRQPNGVCGSLRPPSRKGRVVLDCLGSLRT